MTKFMFTGPAGTPHEIDMPYLVNLEQAKAYLSTLRYFSQEEKEQAQKELEKKFEADRDRAAERRKYWLLTQYQSARRINLADYDREFFYFEETDLYALNYEDAKDYYQMKELDLPSWAWGARTSKPQVKSAYDLLFDQFEEFYEDAWSNIPFAPIDKLNKALEEFYNSINITGVEPDYSVVVEF